jgi:RecJ-like exonuclease
MHHIESPSSNIKSHAYDPVDERLELRFRCGTCKGTGNQAIGDDACSKCAGSGHTGTYSYQEVPVAVYDAFRSADSHGRAFSALIKGKYQHTKS